MGFGPPLKGNEMQIEEVSEAEYLEQENRRMNVDLAQGVEVKAEVVKVEPVSEVQKIIDLKERINAFMAPALENDLKAVAEAAKVIVKVTTPEEREAAQKQATACQKGRTLKVEAPFTEFKTPVTAIGRAFDKRKALLSEIVKTEEDRVRLLIAGYDKTEADKQAELDRLRKLKVSARINDLASKGLPIDTEFAEVAEDGEWELHVVGLVDAKEKTNELVKAEQARKDAAQKRILDRLEIASKLGAALSRDDAELLTNEAFEEERDKWVVAYNQREAETTKLRDEAELVKRAGEAGFALRQCDIDQMRVMIHEGQFADLEAVFMVWLADMAKAKKDDADKLAAAVRLEKRMAQVEGFGIEAAISVLRNATDEEWDCIVEAAKPAPVAVPVVATPAPVAPAPEPPISPVQVAEEAPAAPSSAPIVTLHSLIDEIYEETSEIRADWTDPRTNCKNIFSLCKVIRQKFSDRQPGDVPPIALSGLERALSQKQDEIREELGQVFQAFKDFGNKHCTKELRSDFTVVYLKLKALVERV